MATDAKKKMLEEAYVYVDLASAVYNDYGDLGHFRVTGATTAKFTAGGESTPPSSGTAYVIALTKVKAATKVMLNDTDFVTFAAGDPEGTCLTTTLTKAVDNGGIAAFVSGTAGESFIVMKDPGVANTDPMLLYVQSKSETQASQIERPYYDKGIFKGVKKIPVSEPNTISLAEHFQAHDRGLLKYKGHRFNMLVERQVDRAGTVSESEFYFNCLFNTGGPNEAIGDTDSDFSLDVQYLYKGVKAG